MCYRAFEDWWGELTPEQQAKCLACKEYLAEAWYDGESTGYGEGWSDSRDGEPY